MSVEKARREADQLGGEASLRGVLDSGITTDPSRVVGTGALDPDALAFYQHGILALQAARVPLLVGGAHALVFYAGLTRFTGDFDILLRPRDVERAFNVLTAVGYEPELTFPHWLGKVKHGLYEIDLIFSSGNGVAVVDDAWFSRAVPARVYDLDVLLTPAEELIWTKSFVMERERFDGADVAHLLLALADRLDWRILLDRFDDHWLLLLSHLVMFEFVYPGELSRVPAWVREELLARMSHENADARAPHEKLCRGTLLSRAQYLVDVDRWGYRDARLDPHGRMTDADVAHWTRALVRR